MESILIKNARVVDPLNGIDGICDVLTENGTVSRVEPGLCAAAQRVIDAEGLVLMPGIVDMHTHIRTIWGSSHAQRMLARAGVTTTLDMSGPLDNILDTIPEAGAGLTIGVLQQANAPFTLTTNRPDASEIDAMIERSLTEGALGIKLLGGHFPMDLDVCRAFVRRANDKNAWVAWHAGNSTHGSDIEGCLDAIEAADGRFLHLAHVNSYCRGQIADSAEEALRAVAALKANPNCVSESYLSDLNGTRLTCEEGLPLSRVTRTCLRKLGFAETEAGLEDALLQNAVGVIYDNGHASELLYGAAARDYWRSEKTVTSGSFSVNPAASRLLLAEAKREDGTFVVDAISTDGGAYPRNVILEKGLLLVAFGALTMKEFVQKASLNPARLLRLAGKGHLSAGADADITVFDPLRREAVYTIARGRLIMEKGTVLGRGSHVLCTERGSAALAARGLSHTVIDLTTPLPQRLRL